MRGVVAFIALGVFGLGSFPTRLSGLRTSIECWWRLDFRVRRFRDWEFFPRTPRPKQRLKFGHFGEVEIADFHRGDHHFEGLFARHSHRRAEPFHFR